MIGLDKPRQLPMHDDGQAANPTKAPRFEQVFHRDHRYCDCEIPMTSKKWNEALGTMVCIRLCCLAKAVEKLTGQKLYEVLEFAPRWEWDCEELHQSTALDGTIEMVERGTPPRWLLERLQKKGLPVHNLPTE